MGGEPTVVVPQMGETTNSERADELARRLETLSPEQLAQLRETLRRRTSSSETIPRCDEKGSAPLSFSQQRMWFLDQLEPNSPTNNGARALRLRGPLDTAALQRAFAALVERHEILRTVYIVEQREPHQVALEDWSVPLSVVELADVPAGRREEELECRLREESRRPFELATNVVLRPTLFRVGEDEHVLLYVLHHIAYDASSDRVLNRELAELYSANLEQRKPQLAELPIQYADYAVWQRKRLRGPLLDELTAYWRSALEDTPERLRLPTDRARAAVQLHRGRHRYVAFDGRLGEAVARLARQNGATPYMTLLAAFDALLYGFTGQDDVVIGSPVSGRNHIELEPLIGYFSNTLVLRNRLVGNPTFMELLARVRATTTGAIAHQELPFEKLVEIQHVRRDPSFNPLFQVNFRAETHARELLRLPGIETVGAVPVDIGFSRFDLALELQIDDGELGGYFEYDQDLFDAATIDQLTADFEELLRRIVATPETPLLSLIPRSRPVGRGLPPIPRTTHR